MLYNVSLWSPTKVSTGQQLVYYPIPVPLFITTGLGRAQKSASCELPMTYLLTHLIIWPAVCLSFYPHLTNVKPSWFSIHILFENHCFCLYVSVNFSKIQPEPIRIRCQSQREDLVSFAFRLEKQHFEKNIFHTGHFSPYSL